MSHKFVLDDEFRNFLMRGAAQNDRKNYLKKRFHTYKKWSGAEEGLDTTAYYEMSGDFLKLFLYSTLDMEKHLVFLKKEKRCLFTLSALTEFGEPITTVSYKCRLIDAEKDFFRLEIIEKPSVKMHSHT